MLPFLKNIFLEKKNNETDRNHHLLAKIVNCYQQIESYIDTKLEFFQKTFDFCDTVLKFVDFQKLNR